jgi:hypothetical protein
LQRYNFFFNLPNILAIIFSTLIIFNASVKVMLKVQKDLAIWEKIRTFVVGGTAKEAAEAVTAVPPT